VPGTTVSITNLRAPKSAQKAVERAQKALQKSNFAESEKNLQMAVGIYPDYAFAWLTLGRVYQQQARNEEARKAYSAAIAADDKYVNSYIGLAQLAGIERKWKEMADITDRALALDPLDLPEGYYYNSLAYYNLKKLDIAERSAWKAQGLDGLHRYPLVHLMLANMLERKQDSTGAIDQLQKYLKFAPQAKDAEQVRARLEELQKSAKLLADKDPVRP
jgi:tetratricopeptide (TPR) repeat protein